MTEATAKPSTDIGEVMEAESRRAQTPASKAFLAYETIEATVIDERRRVARLERDLLEAKTRLLKLESDLAIARDKVGVELGIHSKEKAVAVSSGDRRCG